MCFILQLFDKEVKSNNFCQAGNAIAKWEAIEKGQISAVEIIENDKDYPFCAYFKRYRLHICRKSVVVKIDQICVLDIQKHRQKNFRVLKENRFSITFVI